MLEQIFFYIKNNNKIHNELLSKIIKLNFKIINEKFLYFKNYILNTISSDILNLKIKNIVEKLEEIKKNSQINWSNL